jgi:hypothetical protein
MERFVKGPAGAPVTLVEGTTIDKLLDDFSFYLPQERGLAPTTVANYVSLIKKFLTYRFGNWSGGPFRSDGCPGRRIGAAPCTVALPEASQSDDQCAAFIPSLRSVSGLHPIRSRGLRALRGRLVRRVDSKGLADRARQTSAGQLQSQECHRPTRLCDPVAAGTSWAPSRRSCGPDIGGLRLGSRATHLARQRPILLLRRRSLQK